MIRAAPPILAVLAAAGAAPIAAADGDVAYGEYLAAECTTCHLLGAEAAEGGVPLITGWDEEAFILTLREFKTGSRLHGPMQMIAARLGDEEMAALAAYFAAQE
ncbi:c-type cytochrome [Jannaschia ovalis]|uniref:Cytochrome c domain-containing protein n=1 Tax=Jannaschia ovalis TaxID=3038773 RepID=A0ABY8LHK3_9RHOB|nr:c-type cytochrome [Jannaschia sp. GRR-S6-38]WGH79625.1 hypothetical protein P8627_05015 [Jannaschia sp. GRR-S6-38]